MFKVTRLTDVHFKFKDGKEVDSHYAVVEDGRSVPFVVKCSPDLIDGSYRVLLYDNNFKKLRGGEQ